MCAPQESAKQKLFEILGYMIGVHDLHGGMAAIQQSRRQWRGVEARMTLGVASAAMRGDGGPPQRDADVERTVVASRGDAARAEGRSDDGAGEQAQRS